MRIAVDFSAHRAHRAAHFALHGSCSQRVGDIDVIALARLHAPKFKGVTQTAIVFETRRCQALRECNHRRLVLRVMDGGDFARANRDTDRFINSDRPFDRGSLSRRRSLGLVE